MNGADLVVIGMVGVPALVGLKAGVLKPASGVGSLVLGAILATRHHADVAPLLVQYTDDGTVRSVAAFFVIGLAVSIACRVAAALIKSALSALVLGWVDNVAGAAAGAMLGIVLAGTSRSPAGLSRPRP